MVRYYRFQNEQPRVGEAVHCFRTLQALKDFASMMRSQDPNFHRMKYWEVDGIFLQPDDEDVIVRVTEAREISL